MATLLRQPVQFHETFALNDFKYDEKNPYKVLWSRRLGVLYETDLPSDAVLMLLELPDSQDFFLGKK